MGDSFLHRYASHGITPEINTVIRLVIALVFSVIVTAEALARSYDDVVESGYIVFAVYRDFPPYSFIKNDAPAGVDVALAKKIAAAMQLKARFFWLTADESLEDDLRNAVWKGATLDADKKRADIMLRVPYDRQFNYGLDGYGLPRNDLVHMFAPYQSESWSLARDLEKTGEVRNLAIFQYEKIGVEIDTMPDTFLISTLRGRLREQVVHFSSTKDAVAALQQNQLAAVAGMTSQLHWYLPQSNRFELSQDGLEMLPKRRWDIGLAVKQDYRQLAYSVEELIDRWRVDGSLNELFAAYGLPYHKPEGF